MILRFVLLLLLPGAWLHASTPTITIENAWIAEAPPVSRVHAGYFTLRNGSDKAVTLKQVSSESYGSIEMHLSIEKDGVASMQHLQQIDIAAGDSIEFAPGGYHLMLFRPHSRFKQGDSIELHFSFADGSELRTRAMVKKRSY